MAIRTYSTMASGFRGTQNGYVQNMITDQPGFGVPGMLPYASDNTLVDSFIVGADVFAGAGCILLPNSAFTSPALIDSPVNYQTPPELMALPSAAQSPSGLALYNFAGVVVFNENMQSNSSGYPGWAQGRVGQLLRPNRAGGRIFVVARETIVPGTSTVNWIVVGDTAGLYAAGEFAPEAYSTNSATSVAITTAKWITPAVAGGIAIIEFGI